MPGPAPPTIRKPAVAGQFYPEAPEGLRSLLARLAPVEVKEKLAAIALISPHAGYMYSGPVAAETFARAAISETAVILGPNHHGLGRQVALMASGLWQMPTGPIEIDQELAARILKNSPQIHDDSVAHQHEHSLEVQVPFLQQYGVRKIVPICLAFIPYATCHEIGVALARAIQAAPQAVTLVASTDMTHYETRAAASHKDSLALRHILDLDPEGLYHTVIDKHISMCGIIPTTIALVASKHLGARQATLVRYTDSGEVSGDTRQVVGYAGLIVS